jgi:hypothetical protein
MCVFHIVLILCLEYLINEVLTMPATSRTVTLLEILNMHVFFSKALVFDVGTHKILIVPDVNSSLE